jgi:hypothetical protein
VLKTIARGIAKDIEKLKSIWSPTNNYFFNFFKIPSVERDVKGTKKNTHEHQRFVRVKSHQAHWKNVSLNLFPYLNYNYGGKNMCKISFLLVMLIHQEKL